MATYEQQGSSAASPVACRVGDDGLTVGNTTVAWSDFSGFGLAVQDGAVGAGGVRVRKAATITRHYLLFAYVDRALSKRKELVVPLGGESDPIVDAVRQRIPDKWRGKDFYLRLRATLGFSNRGVYWVIAGCIVLAVLLAAVMIAVGVSRHEASHSSPATRSSPRSR